LLAEFYLLLPVILKLTLAKGSVDKPTKIPRLKFPGSTVLSTFSRAVSHLPTRAGVFAQGSLQ